MGLVRPTRDPAVRPPHTPNTGGEYRAKVGVVRKKAGIVGRMGHGARYQGYIAHQKGAKKREMQIEKIPGASKEGRTRAVLPSSCDFYNSS